MFRNKLSERSHDFSPAQFLNISKLLNQQLQDNGSKKQRMSKIRLIKKTNWRNKYLLKKKALKQNLSQKKIQKRRKIIDKVSIGYINIGLRGLSKRSLGECANFALDEDLDVLFLSELKLEPCQCRAGDLFNKC